MNPLPYEIASRLGLDAGSIRFIQSFQNRVYEFVDHDGESRILRITLCSHRSGTEIEEELKWLQSLRNEGANVSPARPWKSGSLVFPFPELAEPCHAVQFEKAPGRALLKEDLSDELYFAHGKLLGELHSISRRLGDRYLNGRKSWNEERYFTTDIALFFPEDSRAQVGETWRRLEAEVLAAPIVPDFFGPVHLDLGYSNFFWNGTEAHAFDFDNCTHAPFIADIAFALYGAVFNALRREFPGDRSAFAHPKSSENLEKVWSPFYRGYCSESPWLEDWSEQLPRWMECAYFRAVAHALRMLHPVTDPKIKTILDGDIANVLSRTPPVRLDFQL